MGEMDGIRYIKEKVGLGLVEENVDRTRDYPMTRSRMKGRFVQCFLVMAVIVVLLVFMLIIFSMVNYSEHHQSIRLKELQENLTAQIQNKDMTLHQILLAKISPPQPVNGEMMMTEKNKMDETTQSQLNVFTTLSDQTKIPGIVKKKVSTKVTDICGGTILVPDENELNYINSMDDDADANESQKCVWLIWTRGLGHVSYNFTTHNSSWDSYSSVTIFTLDRDDGNSTHGPVQKSIQVTDLNKQLAFGNSLAILTSTSKKGQGFRLRFRCDESCRTSKFVPNVSLLPEGQDVNGTFRYIFEGWRRYYEDNERRLMVLRPIRGMRAQISVTSVRLTSYHSKDNHDFLSVFKFSEEDDNFSLYEAYESNSEKLRHAVFLGEENQPMAVYFYSDGSFPAKGFSFLYNYLPVLV